MIITFALIVLFVIVVFLYMEHPKFGKNPTGKRLADIKQSPNYREGQFQNIHPTPQISEGYSIAEVFFEFFFKKSARRRPNNSIPSIKTDLYKLPIDQDILVWFGHSSYFIQIDGKRILVDPVFSGNASPIPGTTKSFEGTDIYTSADFPLIDYLFITHDHYDHIDYETIIQLKGKVKKVICGLGVGAHFEYWGFSSDILIEKDWNEEIALDNGFTVFTAPARHFSGRGFKRCRTLWMSYVLQTPTMKIYIGGDSGYDTHFAEIGNQYGPIDLAILDNGQYDDKWKYIHAMPNQVLQAAHDLKARRLLPVHSAKFALANHPWDEPLIKISELTANSNDPISLATPMIGELVFLKDAEQRFEKWWIGVE